MNRIAVGVNATTEYAKTPISPSMKRTRDRAKECENARPALISDIFREEGARDHPTQHYLITLHIKILCGNILAQLLALRTISIFYSFRESYIDNISYLYLLSFINIQ